MPLEERLSQDLKQAMLAGDSQRVSVLRGLKSAVLYAKVAAKSSRDQALPDSEVEAILAKEAKKRQESADLYIKGGSQVKADAEMAEKLIIDAYLPEPLTEEELAALVHTKIRELGASGPKDMGRVIGAVKAAAGSSSDGAMIAQLVKNSL
jgi:uncharacterized protein YqeY